MSEHAKTLSAVFPFIIKAIDGKRMILLARRQNTGYQDGNWDIAGSGHVDEGETSREASVRECKEELGIDVKAENLTFAHLSHRFSNRVYYDIYFIVNKYDGTPAIMEPDKCSELDWFYIDNLPGDIIECRRIAIRDYQRQVYYSERLEP